MVYIIIAPVLRINLFLRCTVKNVPHVKELLLHILPLSSTTALLPVLQTVFFLIKKKQASFPRLLLDVSCLPESCIFILLYLKKKKKSLVLA